jgi:penicillin-binding protein 2
MCVIANKGSYYTPHFVDSIEHEDAEDKAFLAKYRKKHVVTHASDTVFRAVHDGMHDVTVYGTAAAIKVPGVEYCAKTGTAQNPHGKNHSLFVCFAPKDNPTIAVAVIVENAGYGSTWAGPIGAFMMEKYLNDTIATDRLAEVERIANADLVPSAIKEWYVRKDYQRQVKLALEAANKAAEMNEEEEKEDKNPAINKRLTEEQLEIDPNKEAPKKGKDSKKPVKGNIALFIHADDRFKVKKSKA